ncbi:hypothetical protein Bbelb_370490 [Branchiostoma belcheri]|nr:hypothetical protein Bbelb_370490 [Branchiostoma belcheri]
MAAEAHLSCDGSFSFDVFESKREKNMTGFQLCCAVAICCAFGIAAQPGDPGSSYISEPFLLVADKNEEIILQVNITSGSNATLPLGDVGQPYALDYDPLTDYVYWSDTRNDKIHRARRDGSGRESILDITSVHRQGAMALLWEVMRRALLEPLSVSALSERFLLCVRERNSFCERDFYFKF